VQASAPSGVPPPPPGYQLVNPAPDPKNAPTIDYYNNFAGGPTGGSQATDSGDGRSFALTRPSAPAAAPVQAPVDPRAAAADAQVAQEAQQHPIGHEINDTLLSLFRGTPVGSWADEIGAGAAGLANNVSGGAIGEPYDDAKAYMDARLRSIDENSKTLGHIPTPFGPLPITTEGLKELAGGIASAPFTPIARIFKGASLLPTMVNDVATGVGLGGFYGAGNEEGGGRVGNAIKGAEVGGLLGGAIPSAVRGIGNLGSALTKIATPLPQELSQFHPQAIKSLAPLFENDNIQFTNGNPLANHGEVSPNPIPLGPEGTLGDMGPTMRQLVSGLAARPDTAAIIRPVYENRGYRAPGRIQAAANQALGDPVNMPEALDMAKAHFNGLAKPHYDQFHNTSILTTPHISDVMRDIKASAPGAVRQAQKLAAGDGYHEQFKITESPDTMTPMTGVNKRTAEPVPTGIEYDYIKRAVDDIARKAAPGSNEQRIYSTLARRLRHAVDEALSPNDPTLSSWAKARKFAETGFDVKDGLQYGQQAFKDGITPHQLAYDLKGKSALEQETIRMGYREALANRMGNKSSVLTGRGDSAARQTFNSDFGREKLRTVAKSRTDADNLIRRVDAENVMADTTGKVLRNSETASRGEVNKLYPNPKDETKFPFGATELPFMAARKVFEALTNEAVTEKQIRVATDTARMLVAQGADRNQIALGLRKYLSNRSLSNRSRTAIIRVANAIGRGSRGVLVNSQTTPQLPAAHP
jgi:hypothetical protein